MKNRWKFLLLICLLCTSLHGAIVKPYTPDAQVEAGCRYDLTVCTIFQDEARFLKEWIEYYRLLGVQHFILFNDRSQDNYQEVLQPYVDNGMVELYQCPCPHYSDGPSWLNYQRRIVSVFIQLTRGVSRWVALIDTDEFIVPRDMDNLVDYLSALEGYGQVYIRWTMFGTSEVERIPDDQLMIETLTHRELFHPGWDMLGKSIVKPHRVERPDVHCCILRPGYSTYHPDPSLHEEFPDARIFHYASRDQDFVRDVKIPRRQKWLGDSYDPIEIESRLHGYNHVEDLEMFRFVPELRKKVLG